MTTKKKSALLAGATGLVGGALLQQLTASPHYQTIDLLLRRPMGGQPAQVTEHIVDFNHVQDLDIKVDQVFCALGSTMKKAGSKEKFKLVDYHYILNLGRLAKKHNAPFFLVSSLGADPESSNFYLKVKGETERDLQELGLESLYIFRPSLMHEGRKEKRLGEALLHFGFKLTAPLFQGPLKKYRAVSGAQVARAMMACASNSRPGVHLHESDGFHQFPSTL